MSIDDEIIYYSAESEWRAKQAVVRPLIEEINSLKTAMAERDAMLHGVIKAMYEVEVIHQVMERFDEKAAGVCLADFWVWCDDQEKKEQLRKLREHEELQARKNTILSKLTTEERKILGL